MSSTVSNTGLGNAESNPSGEPAQLGRHVGLARSRACVSPLHGHYSIQYVMQSKNSLFISQPRF